MSVTSSTYTTNSIKITISNETSSTNIIPQIDAAMARIGWTLYDTVNTTTFSPIVTKVYRVLNYDAVTYKYMIYRIHTQQLWIHTSSCESWDASSTHLPTNETWNGALGFPQHYDIKNSFIIIAGSARQCVLWNFINSEGGLWSGVFEFERVASEDTTSLGVPCWAWTNSVMIGTPYGQAANTSISQMMLAFPRTADGFTGAAAAKQYTPTTNRGQFPPQYPQGTIAISGDTNLLHLGSYYNLTYGWDATKTVVSPIAADGINKSMPLGRAYNTGVTKSIGNFLDSTIVTADNTGGWPSAAGTSTEFLLLPMNGGCEVDNAYASGKSAVTYGQAGAAIVTKPIIIGNNVWLAASDGIRTYDMSTGQGGTTTLRYSNASGVFDIVFDGQRTIYGSISTGVVKIDTETFATTLITSIAAGGGYLGIDNKYLYVTSRTASTTPTVAMVNLSTFTVNAGSYTLGTALTVASGFGVPVPDYLGTVYVASQGGTVSSQTMRIASFTADSGTQVAGVVNPRVTGATTVTPDSPTSFYIDYSTGRIYLAVGFATNGTLYELTSALATSSNTVTFATAATGAASQSHMQNLTATGDFRGDLMIVPVRGSFIISPRKVAQISTTVGYAARVQFNYPQQANSGNVSTIATLASIYTGTQPLGFAHGMTTNGSRIVTTFSNTVASDNRINVITGLYNTTSVSAAQTGRLMIKA
jgi:hypothetical protein